MEDPFRIIVIMVLVFGIGLFTCLFFYLGFKFYLRDVRRNYLSGIKWKFIKITAPRTNQVSMLALENIFAQMHAIHTTIAFYDKYIIGKLQSWYSLEIVSFGGNISFIMRVPEKQLDLVKAAFYAQYPECEIKEVDDYMDNIKYDPYDENCEIDIFGFELNQTAPDVVPIKTYRDFEHATAEDKIIDPLSPLFEALGAMEPHEFYGFQLVLYSVADTDWTVRSAAEVNKMLGIVPSKEVGFFGMLGGLLTSFATFNIFSVLKSEIPGNATPGPKSFMNLTEIEKEKLTAIQRKAGKPGYYTKIRQLYIAPKNKMDGTKKGMVIGALRNLGSANHNNLKPDTRVTWCDVPVVISPTLERPYIDYLVKQRKKWVFTAYKERDWDIGLPWMVLNIEELATLYHLPITKETEVSPMDRIASKKIVPPTNLPIGSI